MQTPVDRGSDSVDLAFGLQGRTLPRGYRKALAMAVQAALPWLSEAPGAGLHCQHLAGGAGALPMVCGRTRLVLRLPRGQVDRAQALSGAEWVLAGEPIRVLGPGQVRELMPWGTLYAHLVAATREDEIDFLGDVDAELQALGVRGRRMCGRRQHGVDDDAPLVGYSLMLDGLSPEHALQLMQRGLGPHRLWGCGLFVPHKSAAAVGS